MSYLSGIDFRRKFAPLFQINPLLTNGEAYMILRANSFDVPNTCLDLAKKARRPRPKEEYWVPQKSLNQLAVTERLRGKRVTPSSSPEDSHDQLTKSETTIDTELPDQEIPTAKFPKVKPREMILLDDTDDEAGSVIIVDERRKITDSPDEGTTDIDDPLENADISGSKRSFSVFEISDESDADISDYDYGYDADSDPEIDHGSQSSSSRSVIRPLAKLRPTKKLNQESETRTTPWISKIAGSLFGRSLRSIESNKDQTSWELALKEYREAMSLARRTGEEFLRESREKIMEIEYRAGDSILVELGSDLLHARIIYLYDDENEGSMAHVRYFKHGLETIIGEIASPRELFLTSECANISMYEVKGKIKVDSRGKSGNTNVSGIGPIEEEYYASVDSYFYRLNYDILSESFTEASEMVIQNPGTPLGNYDCCAPDTAEKRKKDQPLKVLNLNRDHGSATGFIYQGIEYHLKDFVYFVSETTSNKKKPYHIGQILQVRVKNLEDSDSESETDERENFELDISLWVDVYKRYDDHFQAARSEDFGNTVELTTFDERRVFLRKSKTLNPGRLDGHCFVMHIDDIEDLDAYKDLDDTFWVQDQIPHDLIKDSVSVEDLKAMPGRHLRYSKESKKRFKREEVEVVSKENGTTLTTLDIFSGAGGLSQGFHESGVVGTAYAIEFDTAACKTFKRNFPDAIVYNHDANKLLEWVVNDEAGLNAGTLYDMENNALLKMPSKGDIDIIIGGPPCQGWSALNRSKGERCAKRELIATYLSYVDFYRPKYFLLENVMGLVYQKLDGVDVPGHSGGSLPNGAVKYAIMMEISTAQIITGYQCQHASLQAGVYGSPSSRTRVIFWASLPGYELPKYPQATHLFDGRVPKSPHRVRRSAPHWPVTIGDCLSDLPSFEWINPHVTNPETAAQMSNRLNRDKNVAQYSCSVSSRALDYVGLAKQAYVCDPLNEYQRKMRKSVPNDLLQNHTIHRLSQKYTEQLCNIPLRAGANYKNMPKNLLPKFLRQALNNSRDGGQDEFSGRYGRQSVKQGFKVVTTKLKNTSSVDWILHPYLHRTYSAREFARAQGFPDSFTWDMDNTKMTDIHKQIGNAVPIPLARAFGNELWKVMQNKSRARREVDHDGEMVDREEVKLNDEFEIKLNISAGVLVDSESDDENVDDQEDTEPEDEVDQDKDTEEEVITSTKIQGRTRMNTGWSRDDAIVLDDSD
ncbi:hypothetical protein OCU04_008035 [Sclerotinia nivalis]|uniref:Cytosine-specific methyltransferase n=1 Tax=Sclerotinia nivalis TaxID=352851 RepID=A0A9X0DJ85_9HELO|nr:hypothetical protein OCU04_008035 [Sclerotinia nivalis]